MLRLHGIRHVPFEREAGIAAWAAARGHGLGHTDLWNGETLPGLSSFDWLLVLGGPMGAYDDAEHAWMAAEKELIRASVDAGKLVLGVCLGAQLMSVVLGGRVTRNPGREIGWFAVTATPEAAQSPAFAGLPQAYEAFHWHGDTFSIPPGMLWTARSQACDHQAFSSPDGRVVGLQFHLETTAASLAEISQCCADELQPGQPFVQTAQAMQERPERLHGLRGLLDRLLDNMAGLG